MKFIATLLSKACPDCRIDNTRNGHWRVLAKTDDRADEISRFIFDNAKVSHGIEGFEFMRSLGLVQHVYLMRVGNEKVRIVSPAHAPNGQFSDLKSLERELTL